MKKMIGSLVVAGILIGSSAHASPLLDRNNPNSELCQKNRIADGAIPRNQVEYDCENARLAEIQARNPVPPPPLVSSPSADCAFYRYAYKPSFQYGGSAQYDLRTDALCR
jgi:hypothetical protein